MSDDEQPVAYGLADLGLGSRLRYALRAAVGFLLAAGIIGGFFYFGFELPYEEGPRFALWTVLGAVFIGLCGTVAADWLAHRTTHASVFFAAALGFLAGVAWAFVTSVPIGFFPGWLAVPIIIVWPLAGTFAFAYADAAQPRRPYPGRFLISFAFALLTLAWIPAVKTGLNQAVGDRIDFARMNPPRRYSDPRGFSIHAAPRGNCVDPAPAETVLPADQSLSPLGDFVDYRTIRVGGRPRLIGYMARLWTAGNRVTGVLIVWLGSGETYTGRIDGTRPHDEFSFRAFYPDGYFDQFQGSASLDRLRGTLTTADALCVRRVMSKVEITLRRQDSRAAYPWGLPQPKTMEQLRRAYPAAFAPISQP